MPAACGEGYDAATPNGMTFGREQVRLHLREAAKPSKAPTGGDHAMVGKARFIGASHDLTHGAGCPRTPCQTRDISVRDDTARRNPPQHVQYSASENRRRSPDRHGETLF